MHSFSDAHVARSCWTLCGSGAIGVSRFKNTGGGGEQAPCCLASALSRYPVQRQYRYELLASQTIQEAHRRQDRNSVKWRHGQKVAVPCEQAIRFSHQGRLEQLVVIRVATPELSPRDRNPFRDRFELGQVYQELLSKVGYGRIRRRPRFPGFRLQI